MIAACVRSIFRAWHLLNRELVRLREPAALDGRLTILLMRRCSRRNEGVTLYHERQRLWSSRELIRWMKTNRRKVTRDGRIRDQSLVCTSHCALTT